MTPINLSHLLSKTIANSRYTYNQKLNGDSYFFMYIKEFDEVYVRVNKNTIVIFNCHGFFSSQEEFEKYHKGFFDDEECVSGFLKEVKKKLTI